MTEQNIHMEISNSNFHFYLLNNTQLEFDRESQPGHTREKESRQKLIKITAIHAQ